MECGDSYITAQPNYVKVKAPYLAAKPIPQEVQVYSLPDPLERVIVVATLADALHSPAVFAFLETLKKYAAPNIYKPRQFIKSA